MFTLATIQRPAASAFQPVVKARLAAWLLASAVAVSALGAAPSASAAAPAAFGFDDVAALAAAESQAAYRAPAPIAPQLEALKYDAYRDIRFRPDRALWRNDHLPFELMFFHPGGPSHAQPVAISEISPSGVRPIQLDPNDYHYGQNTFVPSTWGPIGHAGFRVHYPLNNDAYKDEVITFLGASYFRAIGRGQHYGLSARGLAIDTVGGQGEEFPVFKAFWVQRPAPDAKDLVVYAQMDSKRVTGAYQFTVRPGDETVVDVRARIFVRAATGLPAIATFGIAPLTSMFQHGENAPRAGEFRPEVHDSDGLMVATGDGEWLWRPLINPNRVRTSSFAMRDLKGFGLMQRDRAFSSYEDIEARYQSRPSAWVVPQGSWGPGSVQLVEIPTPDETHDNIVAYWVPAVPPTVGKPLDIAYQIHWQGDVQQRPPSGWAVQSRVGRGYGEPLPNETQFVVDFAGPSIAALAPDAKVEAVVTVGDNGRLIERNAYRNDVTGGWRMTLRIQKVDPARPVELRAFLKQDNNALTETWTTLIQPD